MLFDAMGPFIIQKAFHVNFQQTIQWSYLLQHAFGLQVIGPNRHFQGHNILQVPQEVGSIRVRLNNIHKSVIAWHQAGDHRKLAPVILLQHLKQTS